jgi:AraC-like DNA-binding protein
MPLYMDIHTVNSDSFSVEDVVKAHMEDLAIQDKFGVTQLKYWVNEGAKTLFCLMEGPDKEACHQVHKQSHGNTACNIIEVSDNEYDLFMGVGTTINDLAQTQSGDLDTGYRTIFQMNLICLSSTREKFIEEIYGLIEQHDGVLILEPCNEFMVSFIYASDAISCANSIKNMLHSSQEKLEFIMAISSGRPVDEQGENMFEETKKKVKSLCSLGLSRRIYLDKESQVLSDKEQRTLEMSQNGFAVVDSGNVKLALELSSVLTGNLIHSNFSSLALSRRLGLSKSQMYRKIKSMTGMAPNQLIQESRLQNALYYLGQGKKTIAEIAYESGFNSPTYFTRVFKKRFEISPSNFTKIQV